MIGDLFRTTLFQPLFNALVFLYQTIALQDLGVAIILLTIAVRIILYPLFHKSAKHQRITQQLQPEVNKIKKDHKDDKEKQTKAIMELYKDNQVNPLTPFLLLLLQLPALFTLYKIFIDGFSEESFSFLYSFVSAPTDFTQTFLGLFSLTDPYIPIVVITAVAQFFQGRLAIARMSKQPKSVDQGQAEKIAKITTFIGPIIAVVVLVRLPAAVAVYWLTSTIFSIIQQIIVNKSVHDKKLNDARISGQNT